MSEPEPEAQWFLSSSPESDQRSCEMHRYLGYHAGPEWKGMRRKGQAIPLITGAMVHDALAEIVKLRLEGPGEEVDKILAARHLEYWEKVKEAGFQGRAEQEIPTQTKEEIKRIYDEQVALMDGLVFGWLKTAAKEFYRRFKILAIEQEMPLVVPWGNPSARLVRGSKQDLVVEDERGNAGVINWKTTADWRYMQHVPAQPQTMMECVAAEAHLGRPVKWYRIYGLVKGSMSRTRLPTDEDQWTGPERQDSVLCYGFRMPRIPGMQEEDWKPTWNYVDEQGKKRTLGTRYSERPLVHPLSPLITTAMTSQQWVERLPQKTLNKLFIEAGPYWVETYKVEQYLRMLAGSELRFTEQLREAYAAEQELGWGSVEFQAKLDGIFSRNYSKCDDWFYRACAFRDVCRKKEGWATWEGFQSREAHYQAEEEIRGGGE